MYAWIAASRPSLLNAAICLGLFSIVYLDETLSILPGSATCLVRCDGEHRMSPPSRILNNRTHILLNIQTAATVANIYVPLYYIPLYFQFVRGDTAVKAAVRLLPFILLLVCTTNMASGALLPRIGY